MKRVDSRKSSKEHRSGWLAMNHSEEQNVTDQEGKSKPKLLCQWQFWLAVAAGFIAILCSPIWFILAIEGDKAERAERVARVCDWHNTFTYRSSLKSVDVAGREQRRYGYVFVDRIGEEGLSYDLYDGEENALLCPDVVCWQQVSNRLCLVTKDGEFHSLDFEMGKVNACPSEGSKANAAFASVFALLKERLSKPLRIEQDQVEFFDAYEGLKGWPNLPQIVPEAAKDIMAHCAAVFQGEVASVRCRLTNEHFREFAKSRCYEFKDYDLCFSQGRSVGRRNDDPIFAHFPPGWYGNVIGHHADGFSICEAIRPGSSKIANESLVYVYDSKCEMLWIKYSR